MPSYPKRIKIAFLCIKFEYQNIFPVPVKLRIRFTLLCDESLDMIYIKKELSKRECEFLTFMHY